MTLVSLLAALALRPTFAAVRGAGASRLHRACEQVFNPDGVAAAEAFYARANHVLASREISDEDIDYVGAHAVTYPELFVEAYRRGVVSPLAGLFAKPRLAERFMAANPANALFAVDMLGVTDHQQPAHYAFMVAPLRKLIVRPTAELARLYPQFDIVKSQAWAMNLLAWFEDQDEAVSLAAVGFLDPSFARRLVLRAKSKVWSGVDDRMRRAWVARHHLRRVLAQKPLPPPAIDRIMDLACTPGHPYRQLLWEVLDAASLDSRQLRRLSDFWHRDTFDKIERHALRHSARGLIRTVETLN